MLLGWGKAACVPTCQELSPPLPHHICPICAKALVSSHVVASFAETSDLPPTPAPYVGSLATPPIPPTLPWPFCLITPLIALCSDWDSSQQATTFRQFFESLLLCLLVTRLLDPRPYAATFLTAFSPWAALTLQSPLGCFRSQHNFWVSLPLWHQYSPSQEQV